MIEAQYVCLSLIKSSFVNSHTEMQTQPTFEIISEFIPTQISSPNPPNLVPICATFSAEFLTPASIYLKLIAKLVSHNQ